MQFLLKSYCSMAGISLRQLSQMTGIARVSLSRYVNGVQSPTLTQISKIGSALGCGVSDLVDDEDEWQAIFRRIKREFDSKEDKSWVTQLMFTMQRQYDHVERI